MSNETLQKLSLDQNRISDNGLPLLLPALKVTRLLYLSLADNYLTNQSVRQLIAEVVDSDCHLIGLYVSRNFVNIHGLSDLLPSILIKLKQFLIEDQKNPKHLALSSEDFSLKEGDQCVPIFKSDSGEPRAKQSCGDGASEVVGTALVGVSAADLGRKSVVSWKYQ